MVRLVVDGKQIGVLSIAEARKIATEQELDLVEVAPNDKPPVCRVMDYSKFKYEQQCKEKSNKHKGITHKEMRFSPVVGKHDLETKVKNIRSWLEKGYHVKATVQFKGRQLAHINEGKQVLDTVITSVADLGQIANTAKMDGKDLNVKIVPVLHRFA